MKGSTMDNGIASVQPDKLHDEWRRLANAQAGELKKLGVRGTIANGVAKFEAAKTGQSPPVWFVFSGTPCPVWLQVTFANSAGPRWILSSCSYLPPLCILYCLCMYVGAMHACACRLPCMLAHEAILITSSNARSFTMGGPDKWQPAAIAFIDACV